MSVVLDTYKKGIDIGRSEGIDIGRSEGIDIGRTQGISIGRVESLRIVAKNMKEQGLSMDMIVSITGLSKEDIEKL